MAETGLSTLQSWLLTACTSAGAAQGGGDGGIDPDLTLKSSPRLSPDDRLGIYARGYLARLLECLRAEFPVLRALVGDQVFDLFAQAYVWACPPGTPSLFDLGAGFSDYLEQTRPQPATGPGGPDALPAALARLERARLEAGRARGVETDPDHGPLDPVTMMTTPDLWLRTPESLRLLCLEFRLSEALDALGRGQQPPVPVPGTTHYAVARSGYRVATHVLAPWQHAFLEACGTGGATLHAAASTAARGSGPHMAGGLTATWANLFTWLPLAVDAGMATVVPPCRRTPAL